MKSTSLSLCQALNMHHVSKYMMHMETKYQHHSTPEKEVETEVQSMFHLSSLLYSAIPRMKD
jgi:hypothetical protein